MDRFREGGGEGNKCGGAVPRQCRPGLKEHSCRLGSKARSFSFYPSSVPGLARGSRGPGGGCGGHGGRKHTDGRELKKKATFLKVV